MPRHPLPWIAGLALALGLAVLTLRTVRADDDDDDKEKLELTAKANKIVGEFVKSMPKMKDGELKKAAEAVARKQEMMYVMYQFKPRRLNGFGVGEPKDKITPDAIELKIMAMSDPKKKLTAKELEKQGPALIEMAQRTAAIGEIAHFYKPEKKPGKDPAEWTRIMDEMIKSSGELSRAVESKDPDKVFVAAGKLNASCNDCHAIFRAK
jgi:cytochrome c556